MYDYKNLEVVQIETSKIYVWC